MADGLQESVDKLQEAGAGEAAVAAFRDAYERLRAGETGMVPESEIEPIEEPADADALPDPDPAELREVLDRAVVLKLNGGLGTSMGMARAKALLEVKDGRSFLDLIAEQVLALRASVPSRPRLPLVLMDSFATREDSLAALRRHEGIEADVPLDFLQNKVPKLRADDLRPVSWPADPALEWAPPGHGDVYPALQASGLLDALLERGYRWAFLSNADNLGAVLDPRILAWVAREGLPFASEVALRTEADRKGGHLARRADGGLLLRETAQTPDEDLDAFQDTSRHRFFHTNNLWLDLEALRAVLDARGGVLGLPMIVNRKTVDPSDRDSTPVVQLESAMGAAIAVFDGARPIHVPRTRFLPVKTTSDLFVLRSDAYDLGAGGRLALAGGRTTAPLAELDDDHFKLIADFEAHLPAGPPSLVACDRITVQGDVVFGADVTCRGTVTVTGPQRVPDGAVLSG
jgi:UTP--glucose-1-phosphate uridylyltransferase